jgi:hypothetical protein
MNVKTLFQILLLACLPALASAQVIPPPEETPLPAEYWPEYLTAVEEYQVMKGLLKSDGTPLYDIILDPIEQIAVEAGFQAAAAGNWGPGYLGINARFAEIQVRAKRKVCVFIMDTGGRYDHQLLQAAAWNEKGRDFTGTGLQDAHGHSTHCAGIVGADDPNTPLGAARMLVKAGLLKIVPVKVLNDQGGGTFTAITQGCLYANTVAKDLIAQGWFVVYSYSLGGGGISTDLEAAFDAATKLGVYIVAANGNTGGLGVQYPGRSKYASAVAALQQSGDGVSRAPYSTYGPETFVAAPGSQVLSTYKNGTLASMSGTSMATPHLAGVVAILASIYPTADATAIKAHIQKFATDLPPSGKDDYTGYGAPVINALIDNAPGSAPPPPDPEKRREMRTLTFNVGAYNVYWKRIGEAGGELKTLPASITVSFKTDLYDEQAFDLAKATVTGFFTNRGFILKDEHGFADAAYYARHFFNMLVPKETGLNIAVTTVIGKDALGREVIQEGTVVTGKAAQKKTKGVLQFAFIKP